MNTLEQLKQHSIIVADSGDISTLIEFQPEDATTNPSLIFKAAQLPQYKKLVHDAISVVTSTSTHPDTLLSDISDHLAVSIGTLILKSIPGKISTEVDARLSFDTEKSVAKARHLIELYKNAGVNPDRVLIKLASTWQGIKAAEQLEQEGIHCNLTLLFSFAQARACADVNAFLISPFVGRISDWYKAKNPAAIVEVESDPGVLSVKKIYDFYKRHGYDTVVMGASFRSPEQVTALAGCDRLTVAPALLEKLQQSDRQIERALRYEGIIADKPAPLTESEFAWLHNQDAMAVEKLAEGIRLFAVDQVNLEELIASYLK